MYNIIIDFYPCVGRFVIVTCHSTDTMESFIYIKSLPKVQMYWNATRPYNRAAFRALLKLSVAHQFAIFHWQQRLPRGILIWQWRRRIECHSLRSYIQFPFVDPQYARHIYVCIISICSLLVYWFYSVTRKQYSTIVPNWICCCSCSCVCVSVL